MQTLAPMLFAVTLAVAGFAAAVTPVAAQPVATATAR